LKSRAVRYSNGLSVRLRALFALCCAVSAAALADSTAVPDVVVSKSPIDVRKLHITQTAQVSMARMDIEPHSYVGALTLNGSCSGSANFSLDAYELISKRVIEGYSQWSFDLASVRKVFAAELESAGYPKYAPDISLFEARLGSDADFRVAVTFTNLQFNKCSDTFLLKTEGIGYLKADIEVFSEREQKVVLKKTVESAFKADSAHAMEDREFNRRLLGVLFDNLLADAEFVAAFQLPGDSGKQVDASAANRRQE
jgi:hypothetical protein